MLTIKSVNHVNPIYNKMARLWIAASGDVRNCFIEPASS
jgi:hypothetical protein